MMEILPILKYNLRINVGSSNIANPKCKFYNLDAEMMEHMLHMYSEHSTTPYNKHNSGLREI